MGVEGRRNQGRVREWGRREEAREVEVVVA